MDAGRSYQDRRRGALWGLAIGDALGTAIEFQPPGTFEPVVDFRGGGPHGLEPGQWTDDTSMALALADSIITTGWDLQDQAERYVDWWQRGTYSVNGVCFDIGMTTRLALSRFLESGDPLTSGGRDEEVPSGNGSLMRLAPVPIRYSEMFPENAVELGRLAMDSSVPTHGTSQAMSACRYLGVVLAAFMHGLDRFTVLDPGWETLNRLRAVEPFDPAIEEVIQGSYRDRQPPEIEGSREVVRTLEAALWAFAQAGDFSEAVLCAVNLGDDADTTGAICGQLAGAYWGESEIPRTWRERLARRELIESALTGLCGEAVIVNGS